MAYASGMQGGLGAGGPVIPHELSDHAVLVPDTELLFTAQFHRAGPDLVLTGRDGQHHLIPGYFSSEHHPALVAPNGAHLSPDTVDLLSGSPTPGHYAQAQPTAPPDSIGKIEKVVGDVTVVRNGVSVALHVGDAVFKSDVVQTGASASCGISFPDGTALNLVANTRMALNDYAYDANSNANGALFTLVEGTFAFVAGKVAHSGDMKIATPVATMGIRGTTGLVEEQQQPPTAVTASAADHTYTFAVMPDFGTSNVGLWDMFLTDANGDIVRDANGDPIVLDVVSKAGYVTYVTPQPGQRPLIETLPVTNLQFAFQTRILRDLADTLGLANPNNNGNNGSSTPEFFQLPNSIPQFREDNNTPVTINAVIDTITSPSTAAADPSRPNTPTQTAHWQYAIDGNWNNPLDWSDAFAPLSWQNIIIGFAATVTIDSATGDSGPTATAVNNLTLDGGAILDIVSGGSLVVSGTLDDFGLVKVNSTGVDPTLTLNGPVTVEVGGEIEALGSLATVYFAADTVDNFGKIVADNYGQVFFEPGTTVTNEVGGQIEATDYGILTFEQTSVDNFGTIAANDYGQIFFEPGAVVTNELGGLVIAENNGTLTLDTGKAIINFGTLAAATGGTLTLDDDVNNHGQVQVQDGGTVDLVNDTITGGQISLSSTGTATDLEIAGTVTLTGGTVTLSNDAQNAIISNSAAAELINYDPISGAGTIGDGNLTLDNFATIDATDATPLILATGLNAIINEATTGILEASSGGTLDIESDVTNDGQVLAQDGGTVGLVNATINGGIVTVDGVLDSTGTSAIDGAAITIGVGGTLELTSGVLTIDPSTIDNSGTLLATGDSTLILDDNVTNDGQVLVEDGGTVELVSDTITGGQINLSSTGTATDLEIAGTVTLTGGTVTLSDEAQNAIISNGAAAELINYDPISGAGTIGDGNLTLDNFATIDATDATPLILDTGAHAIINEATTGILESSSGGTLDIESDVTNAGQVLAQIGGTVGLVSASITGGIVTVAGTLDSTGTSSLSSAAITDTGTIKSTGGTLSIDPSTINNSGTLEADGGALTIDDVTTFTNTGTLLATDSSTLTLSGDTVTNFVGLANGTVQVDALSTLDLETSSITGGIVTVAGTLDSTGTSSLSSAAITDTGTIKSTGGTLSIDPSTINNSGTLEADGGALTIDDVTTFTNTGTLLATDSSTLTLSGDTVTNFVGLANGTVQVDALSTLDLETSSITGGIVTVAGTLDSTGTSSLSSAAITDTGTIKSTGGTLSIDPSTINNSGTLEADGGALTIDDVTTFTNIGTLLATDSSTLTLSGDTVTNFVGLANGTVQVDALSTLDLETSSITGGIVTVDGLLDATGISAIDDAAISIASTGTLEVTSGTLTIDPGSISNAGTLEATDDSTLVLDDNVTNTTGTATVEVDAGSTIDLEAATITGGIVTVDGLLDATGSSAIDGAAITIASTGELEVTSGGTLTIDPGSISNAGTLLATGDSTLILDDNVTNTTGTATVEVDAGSTLDQEAATISGGIVTVDGLLDSTGISAIDDAAISIASTGTLEVTSGTLTIDPGSISNAGTLEAISGGLLDVQTAISGGNAIIMAGTLEFDGSSNVNVTFDNSLDGGKGYGELILGDPEHFSGQISGFSGTAPDAADSDQVELLGFATSFYLVQFHAGNEILTLLDAHGDVVKLTFDNFGGTLVVTSSGGKTYVYDPPAAGSSDHASSATTTADAGFDHGLSLGTDQLAYSSDPASSKGPAGYVTSGAGMAVDNGHSFGSSGSLSTDSSSSPSADDKTLVPSISPSAHDGVHDIVSPATDFAGGTSTLAAAGGLTIQNESNGGFTHTALSSLLNVLTSGQGTASSATDTFMLSGGDHSSTATPGSPARGGDHVTLPTVETPLGGDHANVPAIGTPSPFTSVVSADNFVFHPNLGNDNVHNSDSHATVFGSSNLQNIAQPSTFAPEHIVPEIMFDPAHHDATDISTTVSQFHQIASSITLLH